MSIIKQFSRISHHTLTATGATNFTVPPSEDFTTSGWTSNDLALSEFGVLEGHDQLFIRIDDGIFQVPLSTSTGSTGAFLWSAGTGANTAVLSGTNPADSSGNGNIIGGYTNSISGNGNIVGGYTNSISGDLSLVVGENNVSTVDNGFITGENNTSNSKNALISGSGNLLTGNASAILGGTGITGTSNNTAYVANLNIDSTPAAGDATQDILVRSTGGTINAIAQTSLTVGTAEAITISAKVNEAAGISVGQVVYVNGVTGNFPQVALADNTDFSKGETLAVAAETKSDGQTISIITTGLLGGFDTTAFKAGDILYLSTGGTMTDIHPTGIDAVQRIGHAVKINGSTGSMIVELDPLTIIANVSGTVRHQIVNQNTGTTAAAGYTVVNDSNRRVAFGLGSTNNVVFPDTVVIYNEGYGDTWLAVDGDKDFVWYTDPTDSHNNSAWNHESMRLTSDGDLTNRRATIDNIASATTSAYTMTITADTVFMDCTSNNVTATLPSANANPGRVLTVVRVDNIANVGTVDVGVADSVQGTTSVAIDPQSSTTFISTGGNDWWIK